MSNPNLSIINQTAYFIYKVMQLRFSHLSPPAYLLQYQSLCVTCPVMLAVLPVFRCCYSFLMFLFIVFRLCLSHLLVLGIIISDSLPAVSQDVMIYSAEVKGHSGYD